MSTPSERTSSEAHGTAPGYYQRARRQSWIRTDETCVLVEVELRGPYRDAIYSHLGSLTERDGMSMYCHGSVSPARGKLRVSVAVPRAHTPREAEEVVASLLERIARGGMMTQAGSIPDSQRL